MITDVDKTKKMRKGNWVKYLVSYIHSTKFGSISTYRLFQGLRCPTPRYAPTPHTHTQIRVTFLSSTQRKGTGFPPRFRIVLFLFWSVGIIHGSDFGLTSRNEDAMDSDIFGRQLRNTCFDR